MKNNKLFSKALFKQSFKANGLMAVIITVAVCIMLACVMLISGTSSISSMKENVEETIIKEAIESTVKKSAISEYDISNGGEELFDLEFTNKFNEINTLDTYNEYVNELTSLITSYMSSDETKEKITKDVTAKVSEYMASSDAQTKIAEYVTSGMSSDDAINKLKTEKVSEYSAVVTNEYITKAQGNEELQMQAFVKIYATPCYNYAINKVIEKYSAESSAVVTINPNNQADEIYNKYNEDILDEYITNLTTYMLEDIKSVTSGSITTNLSYYVTSKERMEYRKDRAYYATSMLIAGKMTEEDTINELLDALDEYGVTKEKYQEMGFDYAYIHTISYEATMEYRDKMAYEISLLDSSLTDEEYDEQVNNIKKDLNVNVCGSLLDKLPEEVANGIEELGKMDMYGLIVGSIFFKMAGLLLPIIYLIMVSNNLIAGQVDTGSMAYILSTSTKRRQVTFTQGLFLVLSLFLMFVATCITSIVCFEIVDVNTSLNVNKLILINLGAFIVLFAMSGFNFFTSCYFDRSKHAMALGGGVSMFFLVATMLGLFGSQVIPSVVRINALNYFNYVSLISLFDVVSILNGTTTWIWKMLILIAIGIVGYIFGDIKFNKKDLPL